MQVKGVALVSAGLLIMLTAVGLAQSPYDEANDGGWHFHEISPDGGAAASYVAGGGEWNPLGVECRDGRINLAMEDGLSPELGEEGSVVAFRIVVDDAAYEISGRLGPLNQMNLLHRFTAELDPGAEVLVALIRGQTAHVHHGAEEVSEVSLSGSAGPIRRVIESCTSG